MEPVRNIRMPMRVAIRYVALMIAIYLALVQFGVHASAEYLDANGNVVIALRV
jgi:hypothetical protein